MKTIIVYNSKTGFTKKYADWIAVELKCNVIPYKDFSKEIVNQNDIVIFGSRIHAGKIENLKKIKLRCGNIQKLIVFVTGGTPATEKDAIEKVWQGNFSENEITVIPHFYFQSGINYEKMGFIDRIIMKTVAKLLSKSKNKNDFENGFEQAIGSSYDNSSKEYINPLIEFVRDKYNV